MTVATFCPTRYISGMTGPELRAWRKERGLSMAELADLLGMSLARIGDYERGRSYAKGRGAVIPRVVELALLGLEYEAELSGQFLDSVAQASEIADAAAGDL